MSESRTAVTATGLGRLPRTEAESRARGQDRGVESGSIHPLIGAIMLNLNDIALFVQVASARSFAGAARRLGIPANTLSRRMRDLEARLGVRLMQRSTRKLTLTDAGRRLYDRCAAQIDDLTQSVRDLSEDGAMPSGRVRIAAPADFLESFRMEWVSEFLALHPAVTLDFLLDDARV